MKVPFLFLTNGEKFQWLNFLFSGTRNCWIYYNIISSGGGIPESRRAVELSQLLGVNILTWQVLFWYDMDAGIYFSIFLWLINFWKSLMSCCRLYRVTHLLKTCWKGIIKFCFWIVCMYISIWCVDIHIACTYMYDCISYRIVWFMDNFASDLRMNLLSPLVKENLLLWCLSMVSSKLRVHVYSGYCLIFMALILPFYATKSSVWLTEKCSLLMSMHHSLRTLIQYLNTRCGQPNRQLIGIATQQEDIMFPLKELRQLLLLVIL